VLLEREMGEKVDAVDHGKSANVILLYLLDVGCFMLRVIHSFITGTLNSTCWLK